ncbi:hypothetical protein BD311DRAFT_664677 [Dichomitus squalens]|uniref:Uncharacterized protein n=2 Tax=Dichomitus squalens TaxID=114155 RepID=A0A4V2K071_9APHY|nr:hypothetical protein BD311DRAFT_664677 [Dichomitus squalens]
MSHTFATQSGRHIDAIGVHGAHGQSDSPVMLHVPYVERPHALPTSSTSSGFVHGAARQLSPTLDSASLRYSPYPSPLSSTSSRFSGSSQGGSSVDISPTFTRPPAGRAVPSVGETIKLPPIQPPNRRASEDHDSFQLPPISAMDKLRETQCDEPMAVLRRLQYTDDSGVDDLPRARRVMSAEHLAQRRHSLADHINTSSDTSLFASARTNGPPTPVSAAAALSPSFRLPQSKREHLPRSALEPPPSSFMHTTRRTPHDVSMSRSMPPSPYLGPSHSDYGDRPRLDERYMTERAFYGQERPPSPPPSASSASAESPSPSDSARSGWRPW